MLTVHLSSWVRSWKREVSTVIWLSSTSRWQLRWVMLPVHCTCVYIHVIRLSLTCPTRCDCCTCTCCTGRSWDSTVVQHIELSVLCLCCLCVCVCLHITTSSSLTGCWSAQCSMCGTGSSCLPPSAAIHDKEVCPTSHSGWSQICQICTGIHSYSTHTYFPFFATRCIFLHLKCVDYNENIPPSLIGVNMSCVVCVASSQALIVFSTESTQYSGIQASSRCLWRKRLGTSWGM